MPTTSDPLSVLYATDEHVAIEAAADFRAIAPDWQSPATGVDGTFAEATPWKLTSAAVDLVAAGIAAGDVVQIRAAQGKTKGSGLLFAVESVDEVDPENPSAVLGVTLRRIGAAAGVGVAPWKTFGDAPVAFDFPTLKPQIESASWDLNRRFGISPGRAGRTVDDLVDLRDLRRACVLQVLVDQYGAEATTANGDYRVKHKARRDQLAEVLARLNLRWHPVTTAGGSPNVSNRFGLRFRRG